MAGNLEKVFLMVNHDTPDIRVEPAEPHEVAERLAFALRQEWLDMISYYAKFRFAFPAEVFEELVDVRFMGCVDARIPKGTEQFLKASYGDWRTPRKEFNNVYDHPNVSVVTTP